MPLNPILKNILDDMAASDAPSLTNMSPTEGRAMYRAMQEGATKEHVAEVTDSKIEDVPIRIYRPSSLATLPCLVYFHGGGWVIGDLETHDSLCRSIAIASDCIVIAVDYRLSPEYPYPAPLEDCIQVSKWVVDNALALNISQVAVGGDSAGGNLAASVCLKFRDGVLGDIYKNSIVHQLLINPVIDAAMDTTSYTDNANGYILTRDSMAWFWNHYLGNQDKKDPYVSLLQANNLEGLPSATVLTAEFDPLRDEGEAYAMRLKAAGIEVCQKRYNGLVHNFVTMGDLLEDAREAIILIGSELRKAFRE